jgi:hypothetical protein
MSSRYILGTQNLQPIRVVSPASTDILHTLKLGERIDNLSQKYYKKTGEGWVIMCANPEFENEFEIPPGTEIRIPWPLQRVYDSWMQTNEL